MKLSDNEAEEISKPVVDYNPPGGVNTLLNKESIRQHWEDKKNRASDSLEGVERDISKKRRETAQELLQSGSKEASEEVESGEELAISDGEEEVEEVFEEEPKEAKASPRDGRVVFNPTFERRKEEKDRLPPDEYKTYKDLLVDADVPFSVENDASDYEKLKPWPLNKKGPDWKPEPVEYMSTDSSTVHYPKKDHVDFNLLPPGSLARHP